MSRPWMPLYVADYLGDTRRLSTLQHGAYMLLIMEYWVSGSLPTDDAGLAQIAGLSEREWLKIKPAVEAKFLPGWKHKRVEDELAKAEAKSSAARENGSRGARNKWGGPDAARQKRSERLAVAREKGRHTADEWKAMLRAFPACLACGADEHIVKDHITPIYQGGSDSIENIQPLCHSCNSGKGPDTSDLRPADWRDRIAAGMPSERLANASHRAGVPQPQPQLLSPSLRSGESERLPAPAEAPETVVITRAHPNPAMDLRMRVAALYRPFGNPPETGHVEVWLAQGYPPDLIVAVVSSKLPKCAGKPLKWLDEPMREAAEKRPKVAPVPQAESLTDAQWLGHLTTWREREYWPPRLGPPPGAGGCKVPRHLIEAAA